MLLAFGGTAWADNWTDCGRSTDGDQVIRACTNIITAGRESRDNLSIAYSNRGVGYDDKGNHDLAIADETKAIEFNPKNAGAYVERGYAYGEKGDYDREIADETKAIQFNPKLTDAYENRGVAYGSKGDYDREIADETRSLELSPEHGDSHYLRGIAYGAKGDPVKALADFRAAVRLGPASADWHEDALARIADLEKQIAAPAAVAATPAITSQASVATHGPRVALVIGNSAYRSVPALNNPVNDASLIASALRADGFDITVADNLDRNGLVDSLKAFATKADNADWAVVYFAGHGIEMGGTNYLIPIDAKLLTDRDTSLEAIRADDVMTTINGAHSLRVLILDACRDNPFAATMRRSTGTGVFREVGRGLARIEPTQGTVIVYSARPGQVAADGDRTDSPFAIALAHHLTDPGVKILKLFRLVRDDVLASTGNGQEVFQYSSLPGKDFFFPPQ
jgi:tetratricopeptide (TPR) repeat protein